MLKLFFEVCFMMFSKGVLTFCFLAALTFFVCGCDESVKSEPEEQSCPMMADGFSLKKGASLPKTPAIDYEPVVKDIEGWTVNVDPLMLKGPHAVEGAKALKMLANHLQRIAILMPEKQLAQMQKLQVWLNHDHPKLNGMQYHPSEQWLKNNGHDTRLVKMVHITKADLLLSKHHMFKHPAVVLHELAHSYHDQVLGHDDFRIIDAYNKAMAKGIYRKVLIYNGKTVHHYGARDIYEYFAEATEAYFYCNDHYPFVAAELKLHDPVLFDIMVEVWGPLK